MAKLSGILKSRVRHVFSAMLVVLGVITIVPAFNGTVAAHHAEATASVACDGVISYQAFAWAGYADDPNTAQNEYELSRTNTSVKVWLQILDGGGVAPPEQFGAFNPGNGFMFSGTFQWPVGATSLYLKVEALNTWGNGGGAGSGPWPVHLTLPTDCESNPDVTVDPYCDNETANSGDGTVVVTFTNPGDPFAAPVTFDVGAFGGQSATTVTVAVGATESLTYTGLADGTYTIEISLGGKSFDRTFTIDCDRSAPGASSVASCNVENDGQILLTLTNAGGEAVTFTVLGPDAISHQFTVEAGGTPATFTYFDLDDGVYVISITASDGTPGLDQTVTVDCDQAVPSASAVAACDDVYNGTVTITLVNDGTEAVTFTITDPRDNFTAGFVVEALAQVAYQLFDFADGTVTIPIIAGGIPLDVTVEVDCDPHFDLQAICTDKTSDDIYWFTIKNTEAVDLVVTWDGGTTSVPAGTSKQIASTTAPLSLKFEGIEIATAEADPVLCINTVEFEKEVEGDRPEGETYTIRVSRLDGDTYFPDLTFDLVAGEPKLIDLPSTLANDGIDYFIEEIGGTADATSITVNGTGGAIVTASGHLNETISVVVVNGYASVQIDKMLVTTQVEAGGSITYTLQATNTGAFTLDPVVITDLLPSMVAFSSATVQDNAGTCVLTVVTRPQLLVCTMDDALPVGGLTKLITLHVELDDGVAAGTDVLNQSMVQGGFVAALPGPGRAVHSPAAVPPAVVQPVDQELTCPGLAGEVCDLSSVIIKVGDKTTTTTTTNPCHSTTTTSGGGCGTTTTTTHPCNASTTTTGGGCGGTTTTKPSTPTSVGGGGGRLPRTGSESKSTASFAFGLGCIGGAMMLSRPRLPRRWRTAAR